MESQVTIEKISDTELNKVTTTKEKTTIDELRQEEARLNSLISDKQGEIASIQTVIEGIQMDRVKVQSLITEFEAASINP